MDDYDTPAPSCDDCFSPRAALAIRIAAGTVAAASFAWFTYATFPFPQPRRSRCDRISPAPAAANCSAPASSCAACSVAPSSATTLYHAQLQDGAGAVALQAVHAAAYASSRGWRYGGSFLPCAPGFVLCQGGCIRAAQCRRLFAHAFTADEAISLLLGAGLSRGLAGVNSTDSLARAFAATRRAGRAAVVVRSAKALGRLRPPPGAPTDVLFTQTGLPWADLARVVSRPPFLAVLRRGACRAADPRNATAPRLFAGGGRPSVAVHVRRGDRGIWVQPQPGGGGAVRDRWTADGYFLGAVAAARALLPSADVHVFSSTEGAAAQAEPRLWSEYRRLGATVHLDEVRAPEVWAHLMRADVLVLSRSSFSALAGVVNPGCVVYQDAWFPRLPWWVKSPSQCRCLRGSEQILRLASPSSFT